MTQQDVVLRPLSHSPFLNRRQWAELDFLRGLAAIMMIANHAGYAWLGDTEQAQIPGSTILFISSFAPVLFFFVTGAGCGIQCSRASTRSSSAGCYSSVGQKAAILFAADAAMWFSFAHLIGLNFLGFIAFSMLVLHGVRQSRSPVLWTLVLLVTIVMLRFGIGPLVRQDYTEGSLSRLLQFLLGVRELAGFPYPPAPWLVLPLLGFLVGYMAQTYNSFLTSHRLLIAYLCIGLGALTAVAVSPMTMFRWGTISFGFFVASLAALSLCVGITMLAINYFPKPIVRALSLRGVASLALVPVHYVLIMLLADVIDGVIMINDYFIAVVLAVVFAFLTSKLFALGSLQFAKAPYAAWLWLAYGVTVFALVIAAYVEFTGLERYAIQLVLCLALATRSVRREISMTKAQEA